MMQMQNSAAASLTHSPCVPPSSKQVMEPPPPYEAKPSVSAVGYNKDNTANAFIEVNPLSNRKRTDRKYRLAIILLVILFISLVISAITITLACVLSKEHRSRARPIAVDVMPLAPLNGPAVAATTTPGTVAVDVKKVGQSTSKSIGTRPESMTSSASGTTVCVSHCYDSTYVACRCAEKCPCPDAKKTSSFMDSLASKFHHLMDDGFSGSQQKTTQVVSELCVALCGPRFIPMQVSCDRLLSACDF